MFGISGGFKFVVFTGQKGSGKTTMLAKLQKKCVKRNKRARKKYDLPIRRIVTNIRLSEKYERKWGVFGGSNYRYYLDYDELRYYLDSFGENYLYNDPLKKEFYLNWYKNWLPDEDSYIEYFEEPKELIKKRHCDIFWDEVSSYLSASEWKDTPKSVKRFLEQHRKFGIDIYGTAQNYKQIGISARRQIEEIKRITKLMGSKDLTANLPDPNFIWGICIVRKVDKIHIEEVGKTEYSGFGLLFITQGKVDMFDTTQEIKGGEYPPLQHIIRTCEEPDCDFKKIYHR